MSYQSRSTRIKSLARNDDLYWSTIDSYSNVTDVTRSSSRQSTRAHSRNYIDPWDLENYAYIQRSMESDVSNHTPNSALDDISSPYYMESSKIEDCPCYAGLDEQLFYNAKYEMIPDTFTDMEEMSSNSCSGSTVSTIQYRSMPHIHFPPPPMQSSSAYECYANVVIPNRRSSRVPYDNMATTAAEAAAASAQTQVTSMHGGYPHVANDMLPNAYPMEYPQPEYYYDQYTDHYGRRQSVSLPCYECIEMQNMPVYYAPRENHYEVYDQKKHLERFGLSKKGLLQIDYSLSWMNLQRLISSK